MKIWYINPYAGGPGVGRYWRAYHLSKAWNKLGHQSLIVTPRFHHLMEGHDRAGGVSEVEGVKYYFLYGIKYKGNGFGRFVSMMLFPFVLLFWGLRRGFKDKPEIIVYSSAHPFGYVSAWILSKVFSAKIFFEVRDLWPLSLIEIAGFRESNPLVIFLRWVEKFAYRNSDVIVSLLPGAGEHMIESGMSPDKFNYIPNGFSLDANEKSPARSAKFDGGLISDIQKKKCIGKFVCIYAGALGEPNAMHDFVDSLEFLSVSAKERIAFVVVGKGEQSEELKQRCMLGGYDVSFYPQVDKSLVLMALEICDVGFFVMHDLPIYRFGVSLNKLYDYMAAELPVVAAYNSFNDPVAESGCGFSVQPGNAQALAAAFENASTIPVNSLREMGRRGKTYLLEYYEYDYLAAKYLAVSS